MAPGAGATYAMLREAAAARAQGCAVAVGAAETGGRPEEEALLMEIEGAPAFGRVLDLDALIARAPEIAVVDDLARRNPPGSRHKRRWQDVMELLDRGIAVWTTVDLPHLESYADVVEDLTGVHFEDTVPDFALDRAGEVRLIDVEPEDLLRRREEGLFRPEGFSEAEAEAFFTLRNLGALREISLRFATRAASRKLSAYTRADRAPPSGSSLGERVLVAIGPAPGSAYLARWARRTAYSIRADLTAVHVDTGISLPPDEAARLEDNLALARKLGAEVLVVPGPDVAESLVATARAKGATLIVVGRSGLSRIGLMPRRATVSDRILREAAPLDVAIVQDTGSPSREVRPAAAAASKALRTAPRQLLLLAAAFAVLTLAGKALSPHIGYQSVALLFLAALIGLAFVVRPVPLAVAAVLSAAVLNFLFMPPLYRLSIASAGDLVLFGVYFVVAFVTSTLVSRERSRERLIKEREDASSFLLGAAQIVSESGSADEAAAAAARLAAVHFRADSTVVLRDSSPSGGYRRFGPAADRAVYGVEAEAARYALETGSVCGSGTDTFPGATLRFVPASLGDEPICAIGVALPEGGAWTRRGDSLLQSLGRTLSLSVERHRYEERERKAVLELESERLGGILLDSVSHELRTPLTTITGSISALRDDALAEKGEARRAILANALEAADRLNDVVDDLLSLSRIEAGMLRLDRRPTELSELARASIARGGPELDASTIDLEASDEGGPVSVDPALAARLAANLLRNAARYAPPGTRIGFALGADGGGLTIRVRDRGPGMDAKDIESAFTKFGRGRKARGSGLGLGLAICRGIAEAHGGGISAANAPGGGLIIEARLPAAEGGQG